MSSIRIKHVDAIEVLDSRANPTVEAQVTLSDGSQGRGIAPSGASTGAREAVELRDNDVGRYLGKGVQLAVSNVIQKIGPGIRAMSPFDQAVIDQVMLDIDATSNKNSLGANAILAVSLANARAAAQSRNIPLYEHLASDSVRQLPIPLFNILNGGAHANNNVDIQEFMVVPLNMPSFTEALRCGVEIYHALKNSLNRSGYSTAVGDEGGFAPDLESHAHALTLITQAIVTAGYEPSTQVGIALDVASSELYHDGKYHLRSEDITLDSAQLIDYLQQMCEDFPIVSIEDGMAEDDWNGWRSLTERLGKKVQLVGDDVFVTNPDILKRGIQDSVGNAILIKLNQIGTVTETLEAVDIAKRSNYGVVISHRSGETEDTAIADLSVATAAGQIKSGAPCRSERTAKFNHLLRIESALGAQSVFPRSL